MLKCRALQLAEIKHVIYKLIRDFTREEFYDKFGKGSTFPRVVKDDTLIGGCTETVQIFAGAEVTLMEQNLIDIYDLVEHAIDNAFEGQMNLKFYDYLKDSKIKKHEVDAFIVSTT